MKLIEIVEKATAEQRDKEWLKDACEKALKILSLFKRKWFHWEVIGWALARLLGVDESEIDEHPEIGWVVKAAVGYALSLSDKKKERLTGLALLRLSEIPPHSILVEFGGEENYIPAVAAHYRISWNFPEIRQEYLRVINQLEGE